MFYPITNTGRWIFAFDRWLFSPAYLEILRPEIGEFSIHLLYNTRYGGISLFDWSILWVLEIQVLINSFIYLFIFIYF